MLQVNEIKGFDSKEIFCYNGISQQLSWREEINMKFNLHQQDSTGHQQMVIEPLEQQSVRLGFDKFKRNGEWIDLRMQINYVEDDKMFYAQMYARDEEGRFTDLKLQVEFEQLDLSKSVEDRLGLIYKEE
mgnify:CR=1 FL=1